MIQLRSFQKFYTILLSIRPVMCHIASNRSPTLPMKTTSLFALASFVFVPGLMAEKPLLQAVEIKPVPEPKIAICDMPAPASMMKELKGMEANEDAIQSILQNEKAKTTIEKLNAPIVLQSMEDALKHLTRASMEKIDVDFEKQQLVIFAWQGSGADRLRGHLAPSKGAAANFQYTQGQSKDLRTHSSVYAMPKGTEMKVRMLPRVIRCGVGELEGRPMPQIELNIQPEQLQGDGIQLRVQPLQLQKKAE